MSEYLRRKLLFCHYKWRLMKFAEDRGFILIEVEGCVAPKRKSRLGIRFDDGFHMRGSLHYEGLATDFMLYDETTFAPVTSSEDPRWVALGEYWKSIDTFLCRWGGDFEHPDGGHFSVAWGGRA
jgi:hypothetical protein